MANQWGGQSGTPDMLKAPMMPDAFDASADTPPGRRVRLMDLGRANCRAHSHSRIARRSYWQQPETRYRRSMRYLCLPEKADCSPTESTW
jgi:hypothetical protein